MRITVKKQQITGAVIGLDASELEALRKVLDAYTDTDEGFNNQSMYSLWARLDSILSCEETDDDDD